MNLVLGLQVNEWLRQQLLHRFQRQLAALHQHSYKQQKRSQHQWKLCQAAAIEPAPTPAKNDVIRFNSMYLVHTEQVTYLLHRSLQPPERLPLRGAAAAAVANKVVPTAAPIIMKALLVPEDNRD